MSSMFDNYNSPNICFCDDIHRNIGPEDEFSGGLKNLYDKKQRFYGVEAQYLMPFDLYFHLEEENGYPLEQFITECTVELSLCTRPLGKVIVSKVLSGKDVFDSFASDLKITITQEEASQLQQETYSIILKLVHTTGTYILHTDREKILVVR